MISTAHLFGCFGFGLHRIISIVIVPIIILIVIIVVVIVVFIKLVGHLDPR